MKATIGRIVVVKGPSVYSNGTDEAPAMINRVWNPEREVSDEAETQGLINVTTFPDLCAPFFVTSIRLFETRAGAEQFLNEGNPAETVAFFPDRG